MTYSLFTKPWRAPASELAALGARLGFDAVELPVRPGYPVNPGNADQALPEAAWELREEGLEITSVAGPPEERVLAACAEAGVPIVRICVGLDENETYAAGEERLRSELDALVPLLDTYAVTLGVQNHSGRFVASAAGVRALLRGFEPEHIGAVWDPGHLAIEGERLDLSLDLVWDRLLMVNLKNALYRRMNGPEEEPADWRVHWTTGPHGLVNWREVARLLRGRGWDGVLCVSLTAAIAEPERAEQLAAGDLIYAKRVFQAEDAVRRSR